MSGVLITDATGIEDLAVAEGDALNDHQKFVHCNSGANTHLPGHIGRTPINHRWKNTSRLTCLLFDRFSGGVLVTPNSLRRSLISAANWR